MNKAMTISAFCCIDNQEESQYPIDYIYRRLDWVDKRYIFVRDLEQRKLIEPVGATFVETGVRITAPNHIADAQNAALNWLRKNDSADYFLLVQATKLPLESCRDEVWKKAHEHGNRRWAFKYGCGYLRMYCKAYIGMYGTVLIGRKCAGEFDPNSDGAPSSFPNAWQEREIGDWKIGRPNRVLDIGYLSTEMAARHTLQNAKLWKRGEWIQPCEDFFFRGMREQFIVKLYNEVREYNHGHLDLVNPSKDPEVRTIIEDLLLGEDYEFAARIALNNGARML